MQNSTKTLILCVVTAIVAVSLIDFLAFRSSKAALAKNEAEENGTND